MIKKIIYLIGMSLLIVSLAVGQDTSLVTDTVLQKDTVYLFDTTVVIQKQLSDMKSEFYNQAIKTLEHRKLIIDWMLGVAGIIITVLSLVFAVMIYLTYKSRDRMDKEMEEVRKGREAVDKVYDDIMDRNKRVKGLALNLEENTTKIIEDAKKKAKAESDTDPKKMIEFINQFDAVKSIEEYERLNSLIELEGIPKEIILPSIHRNMGDNYFAKKDFVNAIRVYEKYLLGSPDDLEVMYNVGRCYGDVNDYNTSDEYFNMILAKNPPAYISKSTINRLAYNSLKKWRITEDNRLLIEAKNWSIKALGLYPEDNDLKYNLACAESLLENRDEMLTALKTATDYYYALKKMAKEDKDFEKYWDDPEFIALTKEDDDKKEKGEGGKE